MGRRAINRISCALLLWAFLGASSSLANAPTATRVLVLDLKPVGVEGELAQTITASVAVRVGRHDGLQVVSGADVRRIADLAAERTVAGCDTEQCLTELAGAIGADVVVFGEVARIDDLTVVTLGVLDQQRAAVLSRQTVRGDALRPLLRTLDTRVDQLLVDADLIDDADVRTSMSGPILAVGGGVATAAGLLVVGVGLLPTLQYNDAANRVRASTSQAQADAAQRDVAAAQEAHNTWGLPMLVGGAASTLIGVGVLITGILFSSQE